MYFKYNIKKLNFLTKYITLKRFKLKTLSGDYFLDNKVVN